MPQPLNPQNNNELPVKVMRRGGDLINLMVEDPDGILEPKVLDLQDDFIAQTNLASRLRFAAEQIKRQADEQIQMAYDIERKAMLAREQKINEVKQEIEAEDKRKRQKKKENQDNGLERQQMVEQFVNGML